MIALLALAGCQPFVAPFEYQQTGRAVGWPVLGASADDLWAPIDAEEGQLAMGHRTAAGWAAIDVDPAASAQSYAFDGSDLWLGGSTATGAMVVEIGADGAIVDRSAALPAGPVASVAAREEAVVVAAYAEGAQVAVLGAVGGELQALASVPEDIGDAGVLAAAAPGEAYLWAVERGPTGGLRTLYLRDGGFTDVPIDEGLASSSFWPVVSVGAPDDVWVWWREPDGALAWLHGDGTSFERFSADEWTAEAGAVGTLLPLGGGEAALVTGFHLQTSPNVYAYRAHRIDADGELDPAVEIVRCDTGVAMACFPTPRAVRLGDGTVVIAESGIGWWIGRLDDL